MKKILLILFLSAATISCRDKKGPEPVVEMPVPANEDVIPTVPMPETPKGTDGTSVKVDSNGINIDTKGKKHVAVEITGQSIGVKK